MVGGGRHCLLKVFDLRMGGARVYGWATYLSPPAARRYSFSSVADRESPVYALALAPSGRNVFAGTQGRVWELGFADAVRETGDGWKGPMVYNF